MAKEELKQEAEEYTNNLLKDVNCNIGNPRALLEQEFRERILNKYPDIDANRFMDLVEAFLRGYDKGIGIMHNIFYPDFKVRVFDDNGI